jgi:hypothetical protein
MHVVVYVGNIGKIYRYQVVGIEQIGYAKTPSASAALGIGSS